MSISILSRLVDERFLNHRLRATSTAGITGGILACLLFAYRYYVNGVWSWDLLGLAGTIVTVKLAMMAWYVFTG